MDTAKTSTLEGAATTVYAQGGKGNPRLIAWEGEKTLTFTIEDALISDVSLAMLTGADVADIKKDTSEGAEKTYVHYTYETTVSSEGSPAKAVIKLEEAPTVNNYMPVYAVVLNSTGGVKKYLSKALKKEASDTTGKTFSYDGDDVSLVAGDVVKVDYYVAKQGVKIYTITPDKFAGYYYIEASTLFRDEETGKDMPAEFIIPRGKIQSNFTFTMASSGDPSTFTFTVDAFPAYTKFDQFDQGKITKVLAAIQVIEDGADGNEDPHYQGDDPTKPFPLA